MAKTLSLGDVVELLKSRQGDRAMAVFSDEVGVSSAYMYAIYAGERNPGPAILAYLGIVAETTKETTYRKAS